LTVRHWFRDARGELRWPWAIGGFLAATWLCAVLAQITIVPTINALYGAAGVRVSAEGWLGLGALLGAHVIMLKVAADRPWSSVWLDRSAARPAVLARGFAVGALAIALPVLLLVGIGWLDRVGGAPGSWLGSALRVTLFLLPAALAEELATRGYVFAVLRARWGWPAAIAVTSLVFGLLHLRNPGASAASVSLVVLAGAFLAGVLWATRSLYAAWMAHFAWNWVLAVVFHAAVSGFPMESPDYRYVDAGPDWATGGEWGPEGGAAGGLGMLGALAYLYARRTRRREDT
jgi:membrane protease YdiL (CAAX protease family)